MQFISAKHVWRDDVDHALETYKKIERDLSNASIKIDELKKVC